MILFQAIAKTAENFATSQAENGGEKYEPPRQPVKAQIEGQKRAILDDPSNIGQVSGKEKAANQSDCYAVNRRIVNGNTEYYLEGYVQNEKPLGICSNLLLLDLSGTMGPDMEKLQAFVNDLSKNMKGGVMVGLSGCETITAADLKKFNAEFAGKAKLERPANNEHGILIISVNKAGDLGRGMSRLIEYKSDDPAVDGRKEINRGSTRLYEAMALTLVRYSQEYAKMAGIGEDAVEKIRKNGKDFPFVADGLESFPYTKYTTYEKNGEEYFLVMYNDSVSGSKIGALQKNAVTAKWFTDALGYSPDIDKDTRIPPTQADAPMEYAYYQLLKTLKTEAGVDNKIQRLKPRKQTRVFSSNIDKTNFENSLKNYNAKNSTDINIELTDNDLSVLQTKGASVTKDSYTIQNQDGKLDIYNNYEPVFFKQMEELKTSPDGNQEVSWFSVEQQSNPKVVFPTNRIAKDFAADQKLPKSNQKWRKAGEIILPTYKVREDEVRITDVKKTVELPLPSLKVGIITNVFGGVGGGFSESCEAYSGSGGGMVNMVTTSRSIKAGISTVTLWEKKYKADVSIEGGSVNVELKPQQADWYGSPASRESANYDPRTNINEIMRCNSLMYNEAIRQGKIAPAAKDNAAGSITKREAIGDISVDKKNGELRGTITIDGVQMKITSTYDEKKKAYSVTVPVKEGVELKIEYDSSHSLSEKNTVSISSEVMNSAEGNEITFNVAGLKYVYQNGDKKADVYNITYMQKPEREVTVDEFDKKAGELAGAVAPYNWQTHGRWGDEGKKNNALVVDLRKEENVKTVVMEQ